MVIVGPFAPTLLAFRGPLIKELVGQGWQVTVLAPDFTEEIREAVNRLGADCLDYPLDRTGINPLSDLCTVWVLVRMLRALRPQVVLCYNPKPNIYGILAAWLAGVPARFALVEGLGLVFTSGQQGLKRHFVRGIVRLLYRLSLSRATDVFFLNPDDLTDCQHMGLVRPNKATVIGGIGVDLDEWSPAPPHLRPLTFTLIARLLREKGVVDFAEAGRVVKSRYPDVCFLLIGPLDARAGAIKETEVRGWIAEGLLEWVPWTDDVRPYLRRTSVYVLPSYYREGVPRSIQEAMALGRPIITTDAPGCKETVLPGVNGFLVPPHDPKELARAMERFVLEPDLIRRMGLESRRLAEERFDMKKANARLIKKMSALGVIDSSI